MLPIVASAYLFAGVLHPPTAGGPREPPRRYSPAYVRDIVRGRVLASLVQEGMTRERAEAILGEPEADRPIPRAPVATRVGWYGRLGVIVEYVGRPVAGEAGVEFVVNEVSLGPLSDFLPWPEVRWLTRRPQR